MDGTADVVVAAAVVVVVVAAVAVAEDAYFDLQSHDIDWTASFAAVEY
jgi:hypothetical protein